ncbi:hypothetical protein HJG60_009971 [Phyllostomus discolor]|uniref:Uncharacterized protein n=1 Tax=Phyllostomus discolor TaxID=89673 RepID=A0A834B986_9CHIR|nr:hypothetical protein HJG60_009971 [Phyllostomus discolor]
MERGAAGPARSSAPREERTAAATPAAERPPSPLADSPTRPWSPLPRLRRCGAPAGHSGPPRPGGPRRVRRGRSARDRTAAAAQQDPRRAAPGTRPSSPPRGPGAGTGSLTRGGPSLRRGSPKTRARPTVEAGKIKTRGGGAWGPRPGSRTRTSVGAQVCGSPVGCSAARRPQPGPGEPPVEEAPPPASFVEGAGAERAELEPPPRLFNSLQPFNSTSHLLGPRFSLFLFTFPSGNFKEMHYPRMDLLSA